MSGLTGADRRWLDAAVRYATPFQGITAENPAAAALVVAPQDDVLIARAVTGRGGRPHAASRAIADAGFDAAGNTLYVTLEPCQHWGAHAALRRCHHPLRHHACCDRRGRS